MIQHPPCDFFSNSTTWTPEDSTPFAEPVAAAFAFIDLPPTPLPDAVALLTMCFSFSIMDDLQVATASFSHGCSRTASIVSRTVGSTTNNFFTRSLASSEMPAHSFS